MCIDLINSKTKIIKGFDMNKGDSRRIHHNRDNPFILSISILRRKRASIIVKIVTKDLTILTCSLEL